MITFTFAPSLERAILDFCDAKGITNTVEMHPTTFAFYESGFTAHQAAEQAARDEGFSLGVTVMRFMTISVSDDDATTLNNKFGDDFAQVAAFLADPERVWPR